MHHVIWNSFWLFWLLDICLDLCRDENKMVFNKYNTKIMWETLEEKSWVLMAKSNDKEKMETKNVCGIEYI